jgi:branched-chain amino acid transport system ATP-binding protein/urea transport system ATP-binding protein
VSETVLDTRDLSMRFGGVQAVNNVNFSLADRELRCLIGPNGAGKSTFFKCLTGQIRLDHSHGRVFIRGQDVTGWRAYEIVRLGVGIKTQVPSVMNGLTVEENLWLSARRVSGREQTQAAVAEVLQRMSLEPIARRLVGELAHGQRQLVEIGLVLAQGPWLLLLDEPAAGITGAEADQLVRIIHEVNQKATVVVVDHDMQFVRMLGGRVTVMHQGAVLREGPVDDVLADAKVREVYIGSRAKVSERATDAGAAIPAADDDVADGRAASDVVLEVAGLRAGYGHVPVLHGVNLQLHAGEAIGIVGHNGVGKTTLMKTLVGLVRTNAGRIAIDGIDVTRMKAHERSRLGVAYVPQGRGILPGLTALENLRLAWTPDSGDTEPAAVERVTARCRAWRRSSTARAARSPAASSRSSRSAARSSPRRGCCCSTSRRKASSRRSCRRSARSSSPCASATGSRSSSSSRTSISSSTSPTASSSWSAGGSSARSTREPRRLAAWRSCSAWARCGCRARTPVARARRRAPPPLRCARRCDR